MPAHSKTNDKQNVFDTRVKSVTRIRVYSSASKNIVFSKHFKRRSGYFKTYVPIEDLLFNVMTKAVVQTLSNISGNKRTVHH